MSIPASLPGRRRPRPLLVVLAALAAAPLTLAALPACASTPKPEIESALLGLARNAALRDAGLSRRTLTMTLAGATREVEVTYVHVPARTPPAPGAPPVVLVHGTPGSLTTWSRVVFGGDGVRGLCEDHDVWAVEVIGHGVAEGDASPCTFALCADFVAGFLRGMGISGACLVGQSYGGEFAWRAAADHPDLVSRLVLVDSAGYRRPDDGWMPEEEAMREHPLARWGYLLNSPDRVRPALQAQYVRTCTDDEVREMFLVCDNAANWRAMVDLARDENGDREADLRRLPQPTLLVWGEADKAYPPETYGRRFAADLPRAELRVVERCGHYVQEERPEELVRLVREFLARP